MGTISNQTCAKCQHCGEWTNYADDPHHKARMQARVSCDASLDEIALRTARNLMPLMTGSIKELCQLQAKIQIAVREALDEVPNASGKPPAANEPKEGENA